MIILATRISRGGGVGYLSRHLLDKTVENDRVEILAGDRAALHDAQALAEAKRCKFSVRHLSISPEQEMTPAQLSEFLRAIDVEFRVGPDRPRLVVRHVKKGRSHFHAAIAEVDPATLRVLDCRNDYARLEDLARRYEIDHGEHAQPNRAERRQVKTEGFSDIARKRAERTLPGFDRTKLKCAFATGAAAFRLELKTQGLHVADGEKGPILVTAEGAFVAAANRAVGIKRGEFQKFMEGMENERLIGSQVRAPAHAGDGGTQHIAAPAAPVFARNPGRTGQDRPTDGIVAAHPGRAAATSDGTQGPRRQGRSIVPALNRPRGREELFLHRLAKVDLGDLLRRAQELASWIMSIFEPEAARLTRQIEDAQQKRKLFPMATAATPVAQTYYYRRRTTP
ncbi:relaxase/mobilization nuclease domain-containing protein [Sinorhizobium meliloti]|uniref:relaxase/mobilization nuclease domain-containing protein n=1 Tax=Rhizobium meliloti TaxID=382 RepID=UPI000423E747|nr:relaxase/mobilization nuclease domain-containing protein [Sinorhizobium meliloti]